MTTLVFPSDYLLETEADLVGGFGADGPGDFYAVLEEDGCGPEFYSEGAAEGSARAIFDFDVLYGQELSKCFGDVRRGGLAITAPGGAEFEQDRAAGGVDLFAGWTGVLIFG
jgi:hypothetical protein